MKIRSKESETFSKGIIGLLGRMESCSIRSSSRVFVLAGFICDLNTSTSRSPIRYQHQSIHEAFGSKLEIYLLMSLYSLNIQILFCSTYIYYRPRAVLMVLFYFRSFETVLDGVHKLR